MENVKKVALLVIIALGVGGFFVYDSSQKNDANDSGSTQAVEQVNEQFDPEITFSENGTVVTYEGKSGMTALQVLQAGTEVITEDSDFGEFVVGINNVEVDSSKEYWSFYVAGEYAAEGAGTYKTTDGEEIEWKLEQL